MLKKLFIAPILFLVGYFSFIGVAAASSAVILPDESILDLAKPVYTAIMDGQYWVAAMFAVILLVAALNKYAGKIPKVGPKIDTFLDGEYGKPVTVLLVSFATASLAALATPGAAMSIGLAWAALKIAAGAAGGYELIKRLLVPLVRKIGAKAPSWMAPLFDLLLFAFSKKSAVVKAEEAGNAAVIANPAPGAPKSDVTEI